MTPPLAPRPSLATATAVNLRAIHPDIPVVARPLALTIAAFKGVWQTVRGGTS